MLLQILTYTHHLTTMLFGIFLSAFFLGVKQNKKNVCILLGGGAVSGLFFLICNTVFGSLFTEAVYPIFVHLPLFLLLVFYYRFRWLPSIISIMTAYLCCQFSNWAGIFALSLSGLEWVYYLVRIIVTVAVFAFLSRYLCQTTALLFAKSDRELYILGAMPFVYYVFDYSTTKFSMLLYSGNKVVVEFLAFAMCISYVIFLFVYFQEYELKNRAEQYGQLTNMQLNSLHSEIEQVRSSEHRMKILRHDMRHHLNMIGSLLDVGQPEKAREYIGRVRSDIESITPKRFCENATVNLLCSSFAEKAARTGVSLTIDAKLPPSLSISDTEICTLLSNGLENALNAASKMDEGCRWVNLSCSFKLNKLLIEIRNPYMGDIKLNDGLPAASSEGHGYGCRSIRTIVQNHGGLCEFSPEDGVFLLRLMLPVKSE